MRLSLKFNKKLKLENFVQSHSQPAASVPKVHQEFKDAVLNSLTGSEAFMTATQGILDNVLGSIA